MDFDNTEAIDLMIASPPAPPKVAEPKSSVWSAVPRALASGVAKTAAFVGELAKGAGQVGGQMGDVSASGMFSTQSPKEKADSEAARQDLLQRGVKGENEVSNSLRNVAESYRPDPATASTAENLVFGLTEGVSQAVGHTLVAGPFGSLTFGLDRGAAALDDLQRKGVDDGTALAAAGVEAVASGASLLLPVAGQTIKQTVGLTIAGGPAAFVAQQAATRSILERAGYAEIGKQYDPLDPVGLAVATLIPAAFGGMHVAGMRVKGAKADLATLAVEPAATVPSEAVDAAMVHNLTLQQDVRAGDPQPAAIIEPPRDSSPPVPIVEPKPTEELAAVRARVKSIEETQPTHAAELDRVRQEVKDGTDEQLGHADADLLRVAAECALSLA